MYIIYLLILEIDLIGFIKERYVEFKYICIYVLVLLLIFYYMNGLKCFIEVVLKVDFYVGY